jgi:uncharacterized protein
VPAPEDVAAIAPFCDAYPWKTGIGETEETMGKVVSEQEGSNSSDTGVSGEATVGLYHQGNRRLQDRFDTRRLADRIEERVVRDTIDADDKAFIERSNMLFIATVDAHGQPNCSYKGGDPGFVRVLDERTIAFPGYDGNGMYLSFGNVLVNSQVGLLFISFEEQKRLRLNGEASIDEEDELMCDYPEAQFIVRVRAREVFPNCPRYIHKYALVERSRFVPKATCETPIPAWKRREWARDALAANDRARSASPDEVFEA